MGALSWPEEALRANIIAQVSLALNRIWTEWYPSRGYSFNITGSPGYDQAYVNGRTVFAVMERLTAELFNTFVQRSGDAEPYFTEYCDGKTVTCPGMKQWGTVDRAREGMNALQILRYYYGNRVQLITTDNIAAIPSSYPGSPLRRGSTGTNVRILQKQLSRIARDYPSFGKPAVTGTFDEATENSVKKFQKQFSLTADGVVGRATWNKVSLIYVSVKDLAELTSEGETAEGTQSAGGWPGTVLRRGSTGSSVEQVQFWLSDLAQFDSSLARVTVDGSYGAATERAVRAFQQKQSLTADGVVGQRTWNALYAAWVDAQSDLGGTAWPGTALRRFLSLLLFVRKLAYFFPLFYNFPGQTSVRGVDIIQRSQCGIFLTQLIIRSRKGKIINVVHHEAARFVVHIFQAVEQLSGVVVLFISFQNRIIFVLKFFVYHSVEQRRADDK